MAKKAATMATPSPELDMTAQQLRQAVTEAFGLSQHELRRDGSAPLIFKGRKLCEVTSYTTGTTIWYELAAFSSEGGYIAAIKVFKKAPQEKDIFLAEALPSLSALCAYFESYDSSHDISIRDDLTDNRLSAAEAMIKAAALRQRVAEARSEYRAAAGELLTELSRLSS